MLIAEAINLDYRILVSRANLRVAEFERLNWLETIQSSFSKCLV
jgi:hypothetical protein